LAEQLSAFQDELCSMRLHPTKYLVLLAVMRVAHAASFQVRNTALDERFCMDLRSRVHA